MGKLIFAILLLSATNAFAQTIEMFPREWKGIAYYEINKGRFGSTAVDCTGVCREVCLKAEKPSETISVPDEVEATYTFDTKSIGGIAAHNYCGEITLAQIYRLRNFGYQIDWEKIQTKQKCCVKSTVAISCQGQGGICSPVCDPGFIKISASGCSKTDLCCFPEKK